MILFENSRFFLNLYRKIFLIMQISEITFIKLLISFNNYLIASNQLIIFGIVLI
jgi:hypothetical protein